MSRGCLQQVAQERKPHTPHKDFAERIERIVMEACSVSVEEFWSAKRQRHIAWARFLVWTMLFQKNGFRTLPWLGKRYKKDHTTIHNGIKEVLTNPALGSLYNDITSTLVAELEVEAFSPLKVHGNDHHASH